MRYQHFLGVLAIGLPWAALAGTFQAPLDRPATASHLAAHSPLLAAANAGQRVVAVGQRGHIVYSDDAGASWKQASVPVSTDLVAVSFPTATQGWVVGHGGVVLHTADAGATWNKQLDGRQSAALAIRHFESQLAANAGTTAGTTAATTEASPAATTPATNSVAERLLSREKRLVDDGGTQPLMAVYFENETTGYVVGTFNRIFHTQDGGRTWQPWMDRIDNPNELHFYAVTGGAAGVYVAGEQGMVWRLDPGQQRFVAQPMPYQGSVFGLLTVGSDTLLAFGLRGSLFRSSNAGTAWERVSIGSPAGITSGTVQADGSVLLVTQAGEIVRSRDAGRTFAPLPRPKPMAYYGISRSPQGGIVLVGSEGVRLDALGR